MEMDTLVLLVLALLPTYLVLSLVKFLQIAWWKPIWITKKMRAQGITGPPYRFLHGNTKEAERLLRESKARSMDLSHNILPSVQPHLDSWIKTYGRNLLTWFGTTPRLIISEPELIKEMLTNKHLKFPKQLATFYASKLLGSGLVTVQGEKWFRQRKLANRAFRVESLKDMLPAMVLSVDKMLDKWREHEAKVIDLANEFMVLSSDIISRTAFGSSYSEGKIIFTKLDEMSMIIARNAQNIRFPFIGKYIRNQEDIESDRVEQCIRESIVGLVKNREKKKEMGDPDGYGSDLLASLLAAMHETDKDARISMEDVIDECKTFYFAGHETTKNALVWTTLLLAINTDWQEKARKEVIQLLGHMAPSSEDNGINRLKTMTMIINESLRLYPPAVMIIRKAEGEERLGNLSLAAGTEVMVSPLAVHHDPKIWGEDVHLFKPERFAEGVAKATNNTMAFLPFGMGPRMCVGLNLAMMEIKVALSMILQRYALTLSPTYIHCPIQHITTRPQHGLQVILHKL